MMLLNAVLYDQNDHDKLSNETIDKNKIYRSATVRSILDNLSQDSLDFNIKNLMEASNTLNLKHVEISIYYYYARQHC